MFQGMSYLKVQVNLMPLGGLVQPPTLEGGGVSLLILDEATSGLYWPAEGKPSSSEVIFQQLGCLPVKVPRKRNGSNHFSVWEIIFHLERDTGPERWSQMNAFEAFTEAQPQRPLRVH